jgi:aminocarboxymuconate-semialdehyde decarboxylase
LAVVDVHTHYLPLEFVNLLRSGEGPPDVGVKNREGQEPLIVHDNGLAYPVFEVFHDAAAKIEQMDRDGIDVSVMSITPSLFLYWSEPAQTARVCRVLNDAAAALCERAGSRIRAMATVPMNDPEEAANELRRAHGELGLVGTEIGTSVGDVQLDDASLDPFFAAAAEFGTPVMLHPYLSMISPPGPAYQGYHLSNVVGNPLETFAAAARLIVGGVFDRHPGLTVLLVHGGGALPYQLGRLEHAYQVRAETKETARRSPMSYLGNLLFDTVVFEQRSLGFLLELAGPERVLFGTDLPFDMADVSAGRIRDHLKDDLAERVLEGNALAAFGLREAAAS